MPVTAAGCIDGTVVDLVGIQGVIGAGPLASNRDYWRQEPAGTKFWVGSQRDQQATAAHIQATRVDAASDAVLVERGPPTAAGVDMFPLFFPGDLRIPEAGLWQITVRIGSDSGCFTVRVS